jgi:hypothetical protein
MEINPKNTIFLRPNLIHFFIKNHRMWVLFIDLFFQIFVSKYSQKK